MADKTRALHSLILLGSSAATAVVLPAGGRAVAGEPAVLEGQRIRVEARIADGRLEERYLAGTQSGWVPAAVAAGESCGPVSLVGPDGKPLPGKAENAAVVQGALVEQFTVGKHRLVRTVRLGENGDWLHVTTRLQPGEAIALHSFADRLRFAERPDWSYAPSVGGYVPDGQYKAPLVLVQAGRTALGLVPDLDALSAETLRRCRHALDLDVPGGPFLKVGFIPGKMVRHSVYSEDAPRRWTADAAVENRYFVLLTGQAEPAAGSRSRRRFSLPHARRSPAH